ncbi:unnamed protein product [Protopolystoma xenopodis]|uniref:Uncharacterized protein n=1 Tax=Protopolystoma xenopodis TaxID=117903 RepID=A0A448XNE4_9PLAT|nr:unnamed protein product [Protopolystoma xenopodis]
MSTHATLSHEPAPGPSELFVEEKGFKILAFGWLSPNGLNHFRGGPLFLAQPSTYHDPQPTVSAVNSQRSAGKANLEGEPMRSGGSHPRPAAGGGVQFQVVVEGQDANQVGELKEKKEEMAKGDQREDPPTTKVLTVVSPILHFNKGLTIPASFTVNRLDHPNRTAASKSPGLHQQPFPLCRSRTLARVGRIPLSFSPHRPDACPAVSSTCEHKPTCRNQLYSLPPLLLSTSGESGLADQTLLLYTS